MIARGMRILHPIEQSSFCLSVCGLSFASHRVSTFEGRTDYLASGSLESGACSQVGVECELNVYDPWLILCL